MLSPPLDDEDPTLKKATRGELVQNPLRLSAFVSWESLAGLAANYRTLARATTLRRRGEERTTELLTVLVRGRVRPFQRRGERKEPKNKESYLQSSFANASSAASAVLKSSSDAA